MDELASTKQFCCQLVLQNLLVCHGCIRVQMMVQACACVQAMHAVAFLWAGQRLTLPTWVYTRPWLATWHKPVQALQVTQCAGSHAVLLLRCTSCGAALAGDHPPSIICDVVRPLGTTTPTPTPTPTCDGVHPLGTTTTTHLCACIHTPYLPTPPPLDTHTTSIHAYRLR